MPINIIFSLQHAMLYEFLRFLFFIHTCHWVAYCSSIRTAFLFLLYSIFTELSCYQQSKSVSGIFQQMSTSVYNGNFSLVCKICSNHPLSDIMFSFLEYFADCSLLHNNKNSVINVLQKGRHPTHGSDSIKS